jgi:hypothetical protein
VNHVFNEIENLTHTIADDERELRRLGAQLSSFGEAFQRLFTVTSIFLVILNEVKDLNEHAAIGRRDLSLRSR